MKKFFCINRSLFLFVFCIFCLESFAQKQGQARIDSLIKILAIVDNDTNKVNILKTMAFEFAMIKPDTSLILSTEALHLSEKLKWDKGIGGAYHQMAYAYYLKDDYEKGIQYYSKASEIWESIEKKGKENVQLEKARTLSSVGLIYDIKGDFSKALVNYSASLKVFIDLDNQENIAKSYMNIGIVYSEQGNYPESQNYYLKALKIFEELGQQSDLGKVLGNLAILYRLQGEYSKALNYALRALEISEKLNNKNQIAAATYSIALIQYLNKNYDEALLYYSKASKIFEQIGALNGVASISSQVGGIYLRQKNFILAKENYTKALNIFEKLGVKNGIAASLGNLGYSYLQEKKFTEAEKYMLKSLEIYKSIGALNEIMQGNQNLADLYSQINDYKKSLTYYQSAIEIKDSLFNKEKTKEIARKELQFEYEKKEVVTKAAQEQKDALAKAEYDKQIALAELEKLSGISIANKKRELAEAGRKLALLETDRQLSIASTEKQLALAEADKKFTQSEAEKSIAIAEADKKRKVAEADKKRIKAESEKQVSDSKVENEKQKFQRNSIAGGAGVIILSSLLIFFFYKHKRDAVQKQKETALSLQVSETEMKALRSQMNPHFIFNALQSIQTFLLSHKPDDANTYLLKFSKLMRLVLENSQYSEVSLKEDMQALELYMQLESIRLTHPFTYKFHIENTIDVEETTIPPLILQPFVENAIWHGLQNKPGPGHINIYISKKDNILHAAVEDNGVGRDISKKNVQPLLVKKESLGMKLTGERLKLLNELKNIKADFKITDLFTNGNSSAGTRVDLSLPIEALL